MIRMPDALWTMIVAVSVTLLTALTANAGLVTVDFSGTITKIDDPNGVISGTQIGDSFTGTLIYDTSLPSDNPGGDPAYYTYLPGTTPPFAAPLGLTITVGSYTFSPHYTGLMQIQVLNDVGGSYPDAFSAENDVTVGTSYSLLGFVVGDSTGTAFSSTALPTSFDLGKFDLGEVFLTSGGDAPDIFDGTVNVGPAAVPEPTSVTLLALGVLGISGWSRRCAPRLLVTGLRQCQGSHPGLHDVAGSADPWRA